MLRDCANAEMRDRLPELMHGRLAEPERASVAAHVAACADCTAELALLERTRAELAAGPAVSVSRIVGALPRTQPLATRAVTPLHRRRGVRLAASVAFMVAAGAALSVAIRGGGSEPDSTPAVATVERAVPSTAPAPPARSEVKIAVTTPAGPARVATARGISLGGGVSDLSEGEMESLLAALESFDGVPGEEPQAELGPISGGGF